MVCPQKTQRVADVSMQFMTFVEDDPFPEELLQDRESELCPRPFRVLEVEEASPDVLLRCLEKVEGCTLQRFEVRALLRLLGLPGPKLLTSTAVYRLPSTSLSLSLLSLCSLSAFSLCAAACDTACKLFKAAGRPAASPPRRSSPRRRSSPPSRAPVASSRRSSAEKAGSRTSRRPPPRRSSRCSQESLLTLGSHGVCSAEADFCYQHVSCPDRRFLQVCFSAQTQEFVRVARELHELFSPLPLFATTLKTYQQALANFLRDAMKMRRHANQRARAGEKEVAIRLVIFPKGLSLGRLGPRKHIFTKGAPTA